MTTSGPVTPAEGSVTGALPPVRPDLQLGAGYHSPQAACEVRLNTNESPYPPPDAFRQALARELALVDFHRYPDRRATRLRRALAEHHGVGMEEIFCANGSNEALQCLLLAYGGPGRRALVFEPTYALHSHIGRLTGTEVVAGRRDGDFRVEPDHAARLVEEAAPTVAFLCSPNNPDGRAEPASLIADLACRAPGLVVVDEAYGQFAPRSALELRRPGGELPAEAARRLVVVRTFSKTWSMAAVRLGYLVADPEVVAACEEVALPYHLSVPTQLAGQLALGFHAEMESRAAAIAAERARLQAALGELAVHQWPSDANFVLFRPLGVPAGEVWRGLLERSVLVRDVSSREGLEGCLRVTVGTPEENDRFLEALAGCLR